MSGNDKEKHEKTKSAKSLRKNTISPRKSSNTLEAIMWHGSAESDARESLVKFRELPKSDRYAMIKFIDAI